MAFTPRNLIDSAVKLGHRALIKGLDATGRRGREDDAPVVADAPKPGAPGGPKSGTAARTPAQAANGAAAKAGAVPTARSTPRRKAAAKRTATRAKAKKPAKAAAKPVAAGSASKPAAAKRRKPARAAAKRSDAARPSKPAAAKPEPAGTANGAGARETPGTVPTGQTVTSETAAERAAKPDASRWG